MTTASKPNPLVNKSGYIAPTPSDWEVINGKISLTLNTTLVAISKDGRFINDKNSHEIACIDLLEYGQNAIHKYDMGGDISAMSNEEMVMNEVVQFLKENPDVKKVFFTKGRNEDVYTIIINDQNVSVEVNLFEAYWDIKDRYDDYEFEFKIFTDDLLSEFTLPENTKELFGR